MIRFELWSQEKLVFIAIITGGFPVIISDNQNETRDLQESVYIMKVNVHRGLIHVECLPISAVVLLRIRVVLAK